MNVKRVLRDGRPVVKGQCPKCGQWADLDDDQVHGRVSMQCPRDGCTFHETLDVYSLLPVLTRGLGGLEWCPPEYETATGAFDPAGYNPDHCAGCGCPRADHGTA